MGSVEHEGVRTVECLRGRLLAERLASKAAKEEADHMAKRLAELQRQLEEEMKQRERAERRLKLALKKLESLNVPNFSGHTNLSDSSLSSPSETKCLSREERFDKLKKTEDLLTDDGGLSGSTHHLVPQDGCQSSSPPRDSSNGSRSEDLFDDSTRQTSGSNYSKDDQKVALCDEMLALVPVSIPEERAPCDREAKNDVHDVLAALRRVREQLRCSIGGRVPLYSTQTALYCRQPSSTASAQEAATTKFKGHVDIM
ncbi:hypothetical protein HPP92_013886 [Vanilla planifolia]|uniref:Uncharacterized protein n=1 Tax=Vanilla planifolia TaxID=51239 RepID=A0A835UYW3_VANPL|nr:hypothetical protein HPP92_014329 [Vanilla planifolia]KAG0479167.1 hypothetical protein HPP92_013886 [Vanilla planifolia]